MAAKISTVTWFDFPTYKPTVIYDLGQIETKVFYWVALANKQSIVLQWHTTRVDNIARWEWPCGTVFHGDVIAWAIPPSYS